MLSPLDSRYADKVKPLEAVFSDDNLIKQRLKMQLWCARDWLLFLDSNTSTKSYVADVQKLYREVTQADIERVKEIEATIKHDVKACEMFLREALDVSAPEVFHLGLTSEDVNSVAYALMMREANEVYFDAFEQVLRTIGTHMYTYKASPFPTRTHGQLASPTTFGKEMAVFMNRLLNIYQEIQGYVFSAKMGGATGTYAALHHSVPQVDWVVRYRYDLESMGLQLNEVTTQVEGYDNFVTYLQKIQHINCILMDLAVDMWLYISYGYLKEAVVKEQVGSSVMPHKVNPIDFENAEGNLKLSNGILSTLIQELPRSRMQRDLSSSTLMRNIGVAMGHSYLALKSIQRGLKKIEVDTERCETELENHPELLTELLQTRLRLNGVSDPYTLIKERVRGKQLNREEFKQLVDSFGIPQVKDLKDMRVSDYVGRSIDICEMVIMRMEELI